MPVHDDEVRHVAALARIGVAAERLPALARELSSILDHMEALGAVDTTSANLAEAPAGMPLRDDRGIQLPLATVRESFAPAMRDGFFVVPRLESHDDSGSSA